MGCSLKEYSNARDNYIGLIKKELLGPGSEFSMPDEDHELISDMPETRYSIGILFPRNNKMNADNDETSRAEESDGGDADDSDDTALTDGNAAAPSDNKDAVGSGSPDEENLDEEISLASQNKPSSFGLTFLTSENPEEVRCTVSFGTYRKAVWADCRVPFEPSDPDRYELPSQVISYVSFDRTEKCLKPCCSFTGKDVTRLKGMDFLDGDECGLIDAMYKIANQVRGGFVRVPHRADVTIGFASGDYSDDNCNIDNTYAKITALRRKIKEGLFSLTIMFVNDYEGKSDGTKCLFQPVLTVDSRENHFKFREYSALTNFDVLGDEEKSLELQYRNKRIYGTGLGTSADWEIDAEGNGIIFNNFFPEVEVPTTDFEIPQDSGIDADKLSMRYLSDLDKTTKDEKLAEMAKVVDAYGRWIDSLKAKTADLDERYRSAADKNIRGCSEACDRMRGGISLLRESETAWTAFQLANRAMFMQRVHLEIQQKTSDKNRYPEDKRLSEILSVIDYADKKGEFTGDKHCWRLFQIAFLLMSIRSIAEDDSNERDIVDLIWFPTGGGKTEAYLGLTAFTIFYRRLAHGTEADGTAVVMRYTLRLLTAQQFTRASTLICACDYIREDAISKRPRYGKYALGENSITIGLWIGSEHTPNKNDKAKELLGKLIHANASNLDYMKEQNNKFQVLKCPWCGTLLVKERDGNGTVGEFGYKMCDGRHFELFCTQDDCPFEEKLPVQVVDEELYKNPPTLLFATVDKFAMMPWKCEIGSFFGIKSSNRAPELIIQDELHLISGPLGTMVGLYETVIDKLCQKGGVKPKIVASTATIRRAEEQCSALYNREVSQFPHPGLDAEDSFFAREKVIDHEAEECGRKYIGLMSSGKTKAMMEVRSVAALLQEIHMMNLPDEIKDKFWTLAVYFNSLKDLGKCLTLVDDDVKDFIRRMARRVGTQKDSRFIVRADELTSRVKTVTLNKTLDKLEKRTYSKENIGGKRSPSDIVLATNMISVGLDVARLNVMLLVGQPKLTSEYIQASSRIGRTYPGVAFVMYDGSKSRDRSHYEQFKQYHESFYKQVEPTGATPFSKPARDRALHAVVIALMRMSETNLSDEKDASNFDTDNFFDRIKEMKGYIAARAKDIANRTNLGMLDDSEEIEREIDGICQRWEEDAKAYAKNGFGYGAKFMVNPPQNGERRLMKVFNSGGEDSALETMTSMRNVDSSVRGKVLIWR